MLLLQERMRALERLEPTDLPRRGHLHRPPLPAEDPGAHFLPPPRQHERMNVERGGHRLHLHTTLPTEAHRGQLELGAVFLDFLRPCARHRHLPLLGGSVYKSEGGFPVSFKRLLDGAFAATRLALSVRCKICEDSQIPFSRNELAAAPR